VHISIIRAIILQHLDYTSSLNIHLRRYIIGRAAESLGSLVTGDAFFAHAKVRDFYMTILIQQDIIKLEVTVNDATRMQEEQANGYFRRVKSVNVKSGA